jgi:polyisoprenoid-binding protein YceI
MKKFIINFIFLIFSIPMILAQETLQVIDSKITFVIKNAGFNVNGSFSGLKANIETENKKPSKITATIDANTINTNNRSRDKHLRKDDYFDVVKYPFIKMQSVNITPASATQFSATFELTIKNVTKNIQLPFTYKNDIFEGSFTINRLDYGVGESSWILSNDVTVKIYVKTQ